MIQPLSTLRDHNNVFQLVTPENLRNRRNPSMILEDDPETGAVTSIGQARDNVVDSMEDQKIKNLNDFLLSPPVKPDKDQEQIEKNRKLSRNAAIIQAIDAIGETVNLNRNQDEAVVAPSRYGDLGLTALDNIRNLDQEHKVDLRRYNQRRDQVDQFNKQATQRVDQLNSGIDLEIDKMEYDRLLNAETAKVLESDQEKERYYEAGLRSISQGDTEAADFYLQQAGLASDEIGRLKNSRGNSANAETTDLDITPKQQALYDEYLHYQEQADYAQDFDRVNNQVKPYSPTWHMEQIMKELGGDFYQIDRDMRKRDRGSDSERIQRASRENTQEAIERFPNTGRVMQQTLMSNIINATDPDKRQQAASEWLRRNTEMLLAEGVSEDQLDALNEEMFARMVQEQAGGSEQPEATESRSQPNLAGMGRNRTAESDEGQQNESENAGSNRRESLPQHLRAAYDLGDRYLEQKRRVERIQSQNPEFNASFGRREQLRLRQQLADQMKRLSKEEDRQALIDALGFNPLED